MDKIDFNNLPSTSTAVSAENLNAMQTNAEKVGNYIGSTQPGTGENVWYSKGKNLLKTDAYQRGYCSGSNGRFVSNQNNALFEMILVQPSTQYTYSANAQCNSLDVAYFTKDHSYISSNNKSNTTANTFTTPANCYICYAWVNYNNSTITQSVINTLQLQFEQNASRTTYETNQNTEVLAKNSNNNFENVYKEISNRFFQVIDGNATTFEINIPHNGSNNIKSAIVISTEWCGIVSIGSSSQIWVIMLGNRSNTQCTAEQIENTSTMVRVKLTFTGIQYGGIEVICPYQTPGLYLN